MVMPPKAGEGVSGESCSRLGCTAYRQSGYQGRSCKDVLLWSGVLHNDPFKHVSNILAAVGRSFQKAEDLLPLHDRDWIAFIGKKGSDRRLMDAIRFVFKTVDLDRIRGQVFATFQRLQSEDHIDQQTL